MKPVVSAAQIAAQAYAQRTSPPPRAAQPGFVVDAKAAVPKGTGPVRRLAEESDAFKIEISAEALDAAKRDGGRNAARVQPEQIAAAENAAEIAFQPVDSVTGGAGRREAPFAHETVRQPADTELRRPGSLLDITI